MYQQIVATNRERGNGPFNQEFQIEMANRKKSSYHFQKHPEFAASIASMGGRIGGNANTTLQQETRKINGYNVGTNYGRLGGIKHQHPLTREKLSKYLIWEHGSGIKTISPPKPTLRELIEYLNEDKPLSIPAHAGISAHMRGVQKSGYGWRIIDEIDDL
jgi:hypothetical protein